MNSKRIVSVLTAMSLAIGGAAFGQGNSGHPGYSDRSDRSDRSGRGRGDRADRQDRADRRDDQARWSHRRESQGRPQNFERRDERGAGPNHDFVRGSRLPPEYRHRQYVVDDWRGHQLTAPPRGYHWVQTGGDFVLVAIATGIIVQLLLNH